MNIGIVIWSLFETQGGLERAGCDLVKAMLDRGHSISVFHEKPRKPGMSPLYPLPRQARLAALSLDRDTRDIAKDRQTILEQKPDVLIAMFSWETLLWFPSLLKGSPVRLIISEHSAPERIDSKWNPYERRCCLLAADAVHVLLDSYAAEYPAEVQDRIMAIPNAVCLAESAPAQAREKTRRTLLAMGRFDDGVKQYSFLIKAFALLQKDFPDWDLEICGDGKDFPVYKELAKGLGLRNRLRMPGMVGNIADKYSAADLVCVPSRVEGLPMALLEAFHFSLPAVGFADCPGVSEIIRSGENGFLAQEMTVESLADSLALLMREPSLRTQMGNQGKKDLALYSPGRVYDRWERLLELAMRDRRSRIEEATSAGAAANKHLAALQELLARKHPFDRTAYLKLHAEALRQGHPSPFTDKHIAGFVKKHKSFGLSGPHAALAAARRFLRRFSP